MRTTVTLDADVEAALHRVMAERGLSFKQALNDAVRAGTTTSARTAPGSWTRPRDLGAVVDLDHALSLAAHLEDGELVRRMQSGQ